MASRSSDVTSDEIVYIKCSVCAVENRTREAEKFCIQCKDYYCLTCIGLHKKLPALKDHQILEKADFRSLGPDDSLPSFPTQRCKAHQSEVVNVYCKDHDVVLCALCIAVDHRSCQSVYSISDDIDNFYKSKYIQNIKQQIAGAMQTFEDMKKSSEEDVDHLQRVLEEAEAAIKAFKDEIQLLLDDLEQRTFKMLQMKVDNMKTSLTESISEIETMITSLNDVQQQMNKASGNRSQEFVTFKLSEQLISDGQKIKKQVVTFPKFVPDTHLLNNLKSYTMLGNVFVPKKSLYKVKSRKEVNVKVQEDQNQCRLFGSCSTEDQHLLLTDMDNKRLKRVDLSTDTVKDYLDLSSGPIAVCPISRAEVAVTLQNRSVQFVSLGDNMTVARSLSFDHFCCGLTYTDEKLFISDEKKTVYIYNMNGQKLKTVTSKGAEDLFENTRHVNVSPRDDRVLVADYKKGLIILDKEGNYLYSLRDIQTHGCRSICTDGENLFVCGWDSNSVVQIGQDNNMLGKIAEEKRPLSAAFDYSRSRLIVTLAGRNSIMVFELQ